MCPEEMERWGAASIFKESARLLHKHYRLFLPFFLAFYLPTSLFSVFEILLPSPPSTPLLDASVVDGSANTAQIPDPPAGPSFAAIFFSWTVLFLLTYVLETLGTGAVFYITDSLYTPTRPDDDDRSIFPRRVFKFLPRAFLRMFITELWTSLALLLLCLFTSILVGLPYGIISAATGWSNFTFLYFFATFLVLAGIIFLAIAFALAQVVAVLEPGNYGREALKRSTKLARIGRMWTIVAVMLTAFVLEVVWSVPKRGILTGGMPVWAKVVLGVGIVGLDSVFRVYSEVVLVVMYFVYKARFDASGSAGIDLLKRIESAEHSYEPIVEGKGSIAHIGEP